MKTIYWVDCKYIHKFSDQSKLQTNFFFLPFYPLFQLWKEHLSFWTEFWRFITQLVWYCLKVCNDWPAAPCLHKCWACLQRVWRLRAHNSTGCGRKNSPIWETNKFETKEDTVIFYFWKLHRMPFYINVFWTKHHSSGGLEYWYTDVASLGSCPWPWESFQV